MGVFVEVPQTMPEVNLANGKYIYLADLLKIESCKSAQEAGLGVVASPVRLEAWASSLQL